MWITFLLSRSSATGSDAFLAHTVMVTGKQFGGRPYRPWLQADSDSEWLLTDARLLGIVTEEKPPALTFRAE